MRRTLDLLAAAVAPDRCLHCREPARRGALLCDGCRRALPWLPVEGCRRCGLPSRCPRGRCPARDAPFAAAWSPLAYEGPARSLATANKHQASDRVTRWLAAAMSARTPPGLLDGVTVVVPVPADRERTRRRGVAHATRLADAVGAAIDRPVRTPWRPGAPGGPAQHRRSRAERWQRSVPNVRGTVPEVVLLVDDVQTTGATLGGAAGALRAAGAARVVALTAFRTLR